MQKQFNLQQQDDLQQNDSTTIKHSRRSFLNKHANENSVLQQKQTLLNVSNKDENAYQSTLYQPNESNKFTTINEDVRSQQSNFTKPTLFEEEQSQQKKMMAERILQSIFKKPVASKPVNTFKPKKNSIGTSIINQKVIIDKQEDTFRQKQQQEQIKNLAYDLGIDYQNEGDLYKNLFKEMIEWELPEEWIIEFSPTTDCVYYNTVENYTTKCHPYINTFRKMLYTIIDKQIGENSGGKGDSAVIDSSLKKSNKEQSSKHLKKGSKSKIKSKQSSKSIKSINSITNIDHHSSIFSRMSSSNLQESNATLHTSRTPSIMNHFQAQKRQTINPQKKEEEKNVISSLYDKKSNKKDIFNQYREILSSSKIKLEEDLAFVDQNNVVEIKFQDCVSLLQTYKLLYIDEFGDDPQQLYENIINTTKYQQAPIEEVVIHSYIN